MEGDKGGRKVSSKKIAPVHKLERGREGAQV